MLASAVGTIAHSTHDVYTLSHHDQHRQTQGSDVCCLQLMRTDCAYALSQIMSVTELLLTVLMLFTT